jgi:hypothetical protein
MKRTNILPARRPWFQWLAAVVLLAAGVYSFVGGDRLSGATVLGLAAVTVLDQLAHFDRVTDQRRGFSGRPLMLCFLQ